MASTIGLDPETLRTQAKVYQDCIQYISDVESKCYNAHSDMHGHWKGSAYEGYMGFFEENVKPIMATLKDCCEKCEKDLNAYAAVVIERDESDNVAFRRA